MNLTGILLLAAGVTGAFVNTQVAWVLVGVAGLLIVLGK